MLFGFGADTGMWLLGMSPAGPPEEWQSRQLPSCVISPPGCNLRPFGGGFTKLMSSWQALQARLLGWFFQLSASGTGLAVVLR